MIRQSEKRIDRHEKSCPQCQALLFDDMHICFNCLYDFERVPTSVQLPDLDEPDLLDNAHVIENPSHVWKNDTAMQPSCGEIRSHADFDISATEQSKENTLDNTTELPCLNDASLTSQHLIRVSSRDMSCIIGFYKQDIVIGRDSLCDIVCHNSAISRRHLLIRRHSEGIEVENLQAKNPALYRGRPLLTKQVLHQDEQIDMCGITIELVV